METTTITGEIEVLVTNIINQGRTVYTLPGQKIEYDSKGCYPVGVKGVEIYRNTGKVSVSGRFTNRELEAVFAAVVANTQS